MLRSRLQGVAWRGLGTGGWGRLAKQDECKKTVQKLPCVKAVPPISKKSKPATRKVCEKVCMPCCPPARDPPECHYPYNKPPCQKYKPPRPAYSECKKDPIQQIMPCECDIPKAVCDKKKKH